MIPWPSCAKRATGVAAAADLLFALDAVPAAMEAALNRFGRPTTSADAVRRQALRHAARLRDVQEVVPPAVRAAGRGRRVTAPRRSDDLAKTFASIRRQLRRIPTDHLRRAELFTTLTYVARLYVRRGIRSAPRPQTPEDALRGAGIDDVRQAKYQRRFSTLLAGRAKAGA